MFDDTFTNNLIETAKLRTENEDILFKLQTERNKRKQDSQNFRYEIENLKFKIRLLEYSPPKVGDVFIIDGVEYRAEEEVRREKLVKLIKLHCEAGSILEHMYLFDELENKIKDKCFL